MEGAYPKEAHLRGLDHYRLDDEAKTTLSKIIKEVFGQRGILQSSSALDETNPDGKVVKPSAKTANRPANQKADEAKDYEVVDLKQTSPGEAPTTVCFICGVRPSARLPGHSAAECDYRGCPADNNSPGDSPKWYKRVEEADYVKGDDLDTNSAMVTLVLLLLLLLLVLLLLH